MSTETNWFRDSNTGHNDTTRSSQPLTRSGTLDSQSTTFYSLYTSGSSDDIGSVMPADSAIVQFSAEREYGRPILGLDMESLDDSDLSDTVESVDDSDLSDIVESLNDSNLSDSTMD